ncbi:MAG TPA: hypothetical protein VF104_07280, partial [Burkholderiales bacterium]
MIPHSAFWRSALRLGRRWLLVIAGFQFLLAGTEALNAIECQRSNSECWPRFLVFIADLPFSVVIETAFGLLPASLASDHFILSVDNERSPMSANFSELPKDLPRPTDDGAASHLQGMSLPKLVLPATDGTDVDLAAIPGRVVIYIYPMTGRPGVPLPDGWDGIPGARGCTPQSCGFR